MLLSSVLSTIALACFARIGEAADTDDDDYKVVGSLIFGRHNDRPAKPASYLTPIGAESQYQIGQFYRERYFGLDSSNVKTSSATNDNTTVIAGLNKDGLFVNGQIYCEAESSNVILFSHYAFLQGLYPPQDVAGTAVGNFTLAEIANGTVVENPLHGYQYIKSNIQENATNGYIWTKGDTNCPASDAAIDEVENSDYFNQLTNESADFYQSISDIPFIKETFSSSKLNFGNSMNIFDQVWVNTIHNETVSEQFNESTIDAIQFWSDKYQWLISDNQVNANLTIGAKTLMARVVEKLTTTKSTGKPYLNYLTGSFNTMYQLASIINLDIADSKFRTMPNYGATYVFELLNNTSNDTFVKFSFKNGTQELNTYPLFNSSQTMMSWDDFVSNVAEVSIPKVSSWCSACGYDDISSDNVIDMCVPSSDTYEQAVKLEEQGVDLSSYKKQKLSLADAGGIGAGVTIGVFAILGGLIFLGLRLRNKKKTETGSILPTTNGDISSSTDIGSHVEKGSSLS